MENKTFIIDAFTSETFKGNPAAVCFTGTILSNDLMQQIAAEFGFSESVFITNIDKHNYTIRFFTPKKEIALCGHATLAAAKVIFDESEISELTFINKDEVHLKIKMIDNKIRMQFPVYSLVEAKVPETLSEALGIKKTAFTGYNKEINCLVIEIDDSDELQSLAPDIPKMLASYSGIAGVLVTAKSKQKNLDYEYRYFWPWIGTDEDPVTGAVQTFLAPYWATKLNKNEMKALQTSQRTGYMETRIADGMVYIYGDAVKVMEGTLNI